MIKLSSVQTCLQGNYCNVRSSLNVIGDDLFRSVMNLSCSWKDVLDPSILHASPYATIECNSFDYKVDEMDRQNSCTLNKGNIL